MITAGRPRVDDRRTGRAPARTRAISPGRRRPRIARRVSRRYRDPRRGFRRARRASACESPTARCARACCTTCSAATRTRTRASARCASMQQRYHVDLAQAARVEQTALGFLAQVARRWQLEDPLAELALRWAARLHEIGLDVAHSGYHRHGAYLLENADMPGFAREEQRILARIVGGASPQARPRTARGAAEPVGRPRALSGRAAAARRAAASQPQRRRRCRQVYADARSHARSSCASRCARSAISR